MVSNELLLCVSSSLSLCSLIINFSPMEYYQALLLALHKLKVSEELRKSAIDTCEPLVAFALSCGMYSSPAVSFFDTFPLFIEA